MRGFTPRSLLLLTVIALMSACGVCGSNQEAIGLARGLQQRELEALVVGAKKIAPRDSGRSYYDERSGIPFPFADLKPQSVYASSDEVRIHLSGCVDDKVYILIRGFGGEGDKIVELLPGEAKGRDVLWRGK